MTITLPEVRLPDHQTAGPQGRVVVPGQVIPERSIEIDPGEISDLLEAARKASAQAYAPCSGFRVGAALRMADDPKDTVFTGSNVENSSYGATICAERAAISSATTGGFRRIRILAVTMARESSGEVPLPERSPCGICRQVIREFADDDTLVAIDNPQEGSLCDLLDVERILPWGFQHGTNGP